MGRSVITTIACLVGVLYCLTTMASEPPTLQMIIDGTKKTERLLFESESMLIRYERAESTTVTRIPNGGDLMLREWCTAYRNGKWFSEIRFTQPYESKDSVVHGEPHTTVLKDGFVLEWTQHNKSAVLDALDLGANTYRDMVYMRHLSLNYPKYIARSLGLEGRMDEIRQRFGRDVDFPLLPEFLEENESHYRVLLKPELVDGVECWVVEWPGMDRLWVDPKRGFAVRRRTYAWGLNGPLRLDIVNKDYQEVKEGLWLPFTQIETRYFNPKYRQPGLAGKVRFKAVYKVKSIEFDQLTDAFFDITLPPGTWVLDVPREFRYVVTDESSDPFELPIAQGGAEVKRGIMHFWFIAINVIGIMALLTVFVYRRWARKK